MTPPAGVVLAGGASSRMGVDKAFVDVDGLPMISRVVAALRAGGCEPITVLGGDVARLATIGLSARPDSDWFRPAPSMTTSMPSTTMTPSTPSTPGMTSADELRPGPVRAVGAAVAGCEAGTVVVAACDLPRLTGAVVAALVKVSTALDAVAVAAADGRRHLLGAWPASFGPRIDAAIARGVRSYGDLLVDVDAVDVDVDPRVVHNVNRPDDLGSDAPGQRYPRSAMNVPEISVDELAPLLEAGAHLVDVRQPDEFEQARVPGAVLVPLATVPERVDAFRSEGTTYVICRSGARSMRACEFLTGHGVEVANVAGGTLAWIDSGRDVDAGPA